MSDDVKFERILGRWDILALAFGAMVGWGWVVLAGEQLRLGGTWGRPWPSWWAASRFC